MPQAAKRDGRTCAYPPCRESTEAGSNYCPAHADREKLFSHMYQQQHSNSGICRRCGTGKAFKDGLCKRCGEQKSGTAEGAAEAGKTPSQRLRAVFEPKGGL